jgi:hypothetical protein
MAMSLRALEHDVHHPADLRKKPRALYAVSGGPNDEGPDVRTCTHCGEHVAFRVDPFDSWAECPICGHLA